MGLSNCNFVEIFNRPISVGDFVVSTSGKSTLDSSIFSIITPYYTGFMKYNYWYREKTDGIDAYRNLSYYDMVESKLLYNDSFYKLECLDEYESEIYNIYLKYYNKRMKAIEFYNENKNYLPIGSVISNRYNIEPMIYIGRTNSFGYLTSNISGNSNPDNYYVDNSSVRDDDSYYFINIGYYLRYSNKGYTLDDILSNRVSIKEILSDSNLRLISCLKNMSPNMYYIGRVDISPLLISNYDKSFIDELKNIKLCDGNNLKYSIYSQVSDEAIKSNYKGLLKEKLESYTENSLLLMNEDKKTIYIFFDIHDNSNKPRRKKRVKD